MIYNNVCCSFVLFTHLVVLCIHLSAHSWNPFSLSLLRSIYIVTGVEGAVVVGKLLEMEDSKQGYDAKRSRYGNMIDFGIIDPTKVTISALENAVSVATTILSTNAIITNVRDYEGDR